MTLRLAYSATLWLSFWIAIVAFSVACWVGVIALGAWIVQAYGAWPIVRFAFSVGLVSLALFFLSEQVGELQARDAERRR